MLIKSTEIEAIGKDFGAGARDMSPSVFSTHAFVHPNKKCESKKGQTAKTQLTDTTMPPVK